MHLVTGKQITIQTRAEDITPILDAVCQIDPLTYGLYERNAFIRGAGKSLYIPKDGSTTAIHLGTTELQSFDAVELVFVINADTDLQAVLDAIISQHHYEEPVIHICDVQTTRADYDPHSDNPNRWWHDQKQT